MKKKTLCKGYTCGCERAHAFPPYVFAHPGDYLVHTCACGRQNTILDTHIVKTEYPVTRPYSEAKVDE